MSKFKPGDLVRVKMGTYQEGMPEHRVAIIIEESPIVKATGGVPSKLLPAVMAATVAFVTFLTIAPGVLIMSSLVLVITRMVGMKRRSW